MPFIISLFPDWTKEKIASKVKIDNKDTDVWEFVYTVEKAQLENAGSYQCYAKYEKNDGAGVPAGSTKSDQVAVVVLGTFE